VRGSARSPKARLPAHRASPSSLSLCGGRPADQIVGNEPSARCAQRRSRHRGRPLDEAAESTSIRLSEPTARRLTSAGRDRGLEVGTAERPVQTRPPSHVADLAQDIHTRGRDIHNYWSCLLRRTVDGVPSALLRWAAGGIGEDGPAQADGPMPRRTIRVRPAHRSSVQWCVSSRIPSSFA
jgi:hypothetical protein